MKTFEIAFETEAEFQGYLSVLGYRKVPVKGLQTWAATLCGDNGGRVMSFVTRVFSKSGVAASQTDWPEDFRRAA